MILPAKLLLVSILCILTNAVIADSPKDEPSPHKQESDNRFLHGQSTTLFLDHHKSPSLLQLAITVPANAPAIRYEDIQLRAWDQDHKPITVRKISAAEKVFPVASTTGLGGTACGTY